MNWDKLDQRELLEQYLLGLTNREQAAYVEEMLEKDPELAAQLQELKEKMSEYISDQGLGDTVPEGQRSLQDFHDLDHEMITAMTKRNHNLVIWRLALSAACLILLFVSGYLFRQNQNYRLEVAREIAEHAQDDASAQRKIEDLQGKAIVWDSLHTQTVVSEDGDVLIHYLADDQVTFLDLSHLKSPGPDGVYHLEVAGLEGKTERTRIVDSSRLSLVPIMEEIQHIKIWRSSADDDTLGDTSATMLVADFPIVRDGLSQPPRN